MSDPNRAMVDAIFKVWASFYDNPVQQRLYFKPIQAASLKQLAGVSGAVLDLGCGTGELLPSLPSGSVGADLSCAMLRQAAAKTGLAGRLVVADGHELPFADGSFQAVSCLISFQYYLRPAQALREMHRVLAPGGRLSLAALTNAALRWKPLNLALRQASGGLLRVYSPRELRNMLLDAGFTRVDYRLIRPFTRLYDAWV